MHKQRIGALICCFTADKLFPIDRASCPSIQNIRPEGSFKFSIVVGLAFLIDTLNTFSQRGFGQFQIKDLARRPHLTFKFNILGTLDTLAVNFEMCLSFPGCLPFGPTYPKVFPSVSYEEFLHLPNSANAN